MQNELANNSNETYYAIINEDGSGPAMGTGTSIEAAYEDAKQWGFDEDGTDAVEISRETYDAIRNGNPDAPR